MNWLRLLAVFVVGATGLIRLAHAQNAPTAGKTAPEKAATDELQKEIEAFVKGVQEQGSLDDAAKALVTKVALRKLRQNPDQRRLLGGEKLEAAMDRIRDTLSGSKVPDAAAAQQIRETAATWLVEQTQSADLGVAVNATLLLADLKAEGKPWNEGSKRLATLAADAKLKPAVRAAAIAGLARQVDELTTKAPFPPESADAVTPALLAIITATDPGDDPAARWLVSRSLDVVAKAVPVASPDLAKALLNVMANPARSTDERVRAVIALGRTATKESGFDGQAAVLAIRQVALDALVDSLQTAKDRALAESLSGIPAAVVEQPGISGVAATLPAYPLGEAEVNRDAWRLLKLSEAIAKPKVKKDKSGVFQPLWAEPLEGGLCRLIAANGEAIELAMQLRSEAFAIDEDGTASRVAEAHETILTWSPAGK